MRKIKRRGGDMIRKTLITLFIVILLWPLLAFSQEKGKYQFFIEEVSLPSGGAGKSPIWTTEKRIIRFDTITGQVWTFSWIGRTIDGKWYIRGEWFELTGSILPVVEKGEQLTH